MHILLPAPPCSGLNGFLLGSHLILGDAGRVRDEHPRLRGGRARQGSRPQVRRRRAGQWCLDLPSTSHSACVASPSAPLFCRLGSYNARVLSLQSKFGSILVLEKIVRFKPKRACTCTPLINRLEFQVFAVRVHIVGPQYFDVMTSTRGHGGCTSFGFNPWSAFSADCFCFCFVL
jgi:ribosomal protein S30